MKMSDTIGALAKSLVAAQREMRTIGFDSENPHFKSKFASLTAILETVRPILAAHGLALLQGGSVPLVNEQGMVIGIAVETTLLHESGEWITNAVVMPLSKHDPQGAGAAITYGRRYGASAILSLATDEDTDGNDAVVQAAREVRRAVERVTAPPQYVVAPAAAPSAPTRPAAPPRRGATGVMPFGDFKGEPLDSQKITDKDLHSAMQWVRKGGDERIEKFRKFLDEGALELQRRTNLRQPTPPTPTTSFEDEPFPMTGGSEEDGLPF